MTRPVIVLLLLLSTAMMMRGVASDWRKGPPVPAEVQAKKATLPTPAAPPPSQGKAFQPVVPAELPDLKEGYLFNQERMLAGAEPPPPEEGTLDQEIKPPGIAASIDEVTYTGSIITEATSRALIVYPAQAKTKAKAAAPVPQSLKSSRTFKGRMPAAPSSSGGGEEHGRLEVGDVLDGYEVAEILPNKLIFTKGEETIEKLLHDPAKKRAAPSSPPAGSMPGGARPPQAAGQAGGAPAAPGGVRSTTIGGAGPATAATPAAPGQPTPPTPPAPAAPPAITSSTHSAAAPAAKGMQPSAPVRRMVISRQPAPGPNTSRVLRQSPDAGDMTPPPPGMIPGGNVPPLPTPGEE